MSMRITSQSMNARVLGDLQAAQARVARSQQEVSTGKRITQASDDALGTSDALKARSALDAIDKNQASVASATSWVNATDDALGQITDVMARVKELTLSGANGATTDSGRAAMAKEIGQLIESVKDAANVKVGDAYVFGGTATTTKPYASGPVDAYNGDAGTIARSIGPGVSLQVNTTGAQVLGSGGGDGQLLDTLRNIQAHLTANDTASLQTTDLQALTANLDTITAQQATVGATQNRLDAAGARLSDSEAITNGVLNDVEGADIAESLMNLTSQSTAYQAALKTAANVLQPSLLDFLR
jgi:flagellar hook-associated protein 3 FlgL